GRRKGGARGRTGRAGSLGRIRPPFASGVPEFQGHPRRGSSCLSATEGRARPEHTRDAASPMSYAAEISRSSATAILMVIDQSTSMNHRLQTGQTKATFLADVLVYG